MAATQVRGAQMQSGTVLGAQIGDGSVGRADLNVGTVGSAVIRKALQGAGITITTADGADAGTGDVTIKIDPTVDHAFTASQSVTVNSSGQFGWVTKNLSTGTGSAAVFQALNSGSNSCIFGLLSTGYSSTGVLIANAGFIYTDSPIGLSIDANNATGTIKFSAGGNIKTAELTGGTFNVTTGYQLAGVEFPIAANGIVRRTAANTYAAATVSDIQSLLPVEKVTWYTATGAGTHTTAVGARALVVECWGGGGAGGGAVAAASNSSSGSGGGAGGYSAKYITGSLQSTYNFTIGAGGTGVTGVAGNNGGDTSFPTVTPVCVGKGGTGGGTLASGTNYVALAGGAGGILGTGDLTIRGGTGATTWRLSGTQALSGEGAASALGDGGVASPGAIAGGASFTPASGGGGAMSLSATSVAGGAGGNGMIKVTEYF